MNQIRILGILLAIIIFGISVYAGSLADPYHDRDYKVSVNNQTDNYNISEYGQVSHHSTDKPARYDYSELSDSSKRMFDQNTGIKKIEKGILEGRYDANVCREFTVVCNAYNPDNLPNEFNYDERINQEGIIVEKDDKEHYFSVRRSDYQPAGTSFIDLEKVSIGFLRVLISFCGLFIGSVMLGSSYQVGSKNKKEVGKIAIALMLAISIISFITVFFTTSQNAPIGAILGMSLFGSIIGILGVIACLVPVLLGIKLSEDSKSVRESIAGGVCISLFTLATPYFEMYEIVNTEVSRLIFLLLVIIYLPVLFRDHMNKPSD